MDLNRTLDQITKDIIKTVLDRNDGNQSAAARQLGISRTTMWRYLSRDN
ncbi:MAG: helix-turn-helix domain-containing protein [Lachnospiraceae bacterium]|nr:helix-turn-helix domain-containing protein [Lachnospiraceae bacterium]